MPAFAWKLNDQQIADVLTYIRNSWGNEGKQIDASDVRILRRDLAKERRDEILRNHASGAGYR